MTTFYIDPSATANGTGTLAAPYNTWVGVTLTANNTYLQRRGTTYTGAAVRPQSQTSAAATPLTIGAYFNSDGSDDTTKPKPILNHNGGTNGVGAIFVDTCAYVVVQDIAGTNSHGSLGAGVTIRRSQHVTVQRCAGYSNDYGVMVYQDQASGTSTTTDILIDSNEFYSNVAAGISFQYGATSTAVIKRMTISNNYVHDNGTGKGLGGTSHASSVPCGGINCFPSQRTATTSDLRCVDILVTRNRVADNYGYGINLEMLGNDAIQSAVSLNEVTGSGISLDMDSHSIWVGNSFGVLVEKNHVHHNFAKANYTSGSGVGIYIDYNSITAFGGSGNVVRYNSVHDQYTGVTQVVGGSSGIHVNANTGTCIYGNVIERCRNGIGLDGQTFDGTQVFNNTVLNVTERGIWNTKGLNTPIRNNLISGCDVGVLIATSGAGGSTETYNAISSYVTGAVCNGTASAMTPTSAAGSDVTAAPSLDSNRRPAVGSPLISAGVHIDYRADAAGYQFWNPPSIGAYEYQRTRTTR